MKDIDVASHWKLVESIVWGYIDARVKMVDDIAEWCAENSEGLYSASELDNPIGKALWNIPTEPNRVLLRRRITSDQVDEHLLVLHIKGFVDAYDRIRDSETFLKHLVLHEVAHIKHDWGQDRENDCDRWAFEELGNW